MFDDRMRMSLVVHACFLAVLFGGCDEAVLWGKDGI